MKIENKLRKRIKTITILKKEYPKEMEISKEEYDEIKKDKLDGVKLIVK
jgi:hypothetical protein